VKSGKFEKSIDPYLDLDVYGVVFDYYFPKAYRFSYFLMCSCFAIPFVNSSEGFEFRLHSLGISYYLD